MSGRHDRPGKPGSSHKRSRSMALPENEMPIIEGWLSRESVVVSDLVNPRYGALYASAFYTYRKLGANDTPSRSFPILSSCTVSDVVAKHCHLRSAKTSTLWAVAARAYETVQMFSFTIRWNAAGFMGPDALTLCFEERAVADEWRSKFAEAIAAVERKPVSMRPLVQLSEQSTTSTNGAVQLQDSIAGQSYAPSLGRNSSDSQPAADAEPSTGTGSSATYRSRTWSSVQHVNGVAVYMEDTDEDGEGGAMMVSAAVRTPPADVFRALLQMRQTEGPALFSDCAVVEVVDAHTQVIRQQVRVGGVAGALCAPREMVLLRTWRRQDDGTIIVLYQSTKHRAVRQEQGRWSWHTPVRAQVQAAGFTIAPLMPKYTTSPGESKECLVTLVIKMDLGGWLSDWHQSKLGPLMGGAVNAWLQLVVTSVCMLRDRVEQDRFVIRPYSWGQQADASLDAVDAEEARGSAAARDSLRKSTTMLVRSPQGRPSPAAPKSMAELSTTPLRVDTIKEMPSPELPSAAARAISEDDRASDAGPSAEQDADAWAHGGTVDRRYYACPGQATFKLRGPNYLQDKKKSAALPPMFELVACDLLQLEEPIWHVARHLPSIRTSPAPFLFVLQMMIPASPPLSLSCAWAAPYDPMRKDAETLIQEFTAEHGSCEPSVAAFFRAFGSFLEGDGPEADKRRNKMFKLIPSIPKGSWIIKQAVGSTPVLLGQKLITRYSRGERFFEASIDIGSSSVASSVVNLVAGATKSLVIDLGVLVEGQTAEHLPEHLLGSVRFQHLDLSTAAYLDDVSGKVLCMGDIK